MSIAEQPLSRRRSTVEDACGPPSALPSPPHSPSVMLAVPPTSAEKLALASSASTPTSAPAPASTSSLASSPVPPSRQKRSRAIFDEQPPDTCAADRHARRKEQNRRAQQAFRARKEGEVGGLRAVVRACAHSIDTHLAAHPAHHVEERAFLRAWRAANPEACPTTPRNLVTPAPEAHNAPEVPQLFKMEDNTEEQFYADSASSHTGPSRAPSTRAPELELDVVSQYRAELAAVHRDLAEARAHARQVEAAALAWTREREAETTSLRVTLLDVARKLREAQGERDAAVARYEDAREECAAAVQRAEKAERAAGECRNSAVMTPAVLDAIRTLGRCVRDMETS